jgi:hypothetical protein
MPRGLITAGLCLCALLATGRARASQDDVPLPLEAPDALFGAQTGWLTQIAGSADVGVYPFQGSGHHRSHGRVRGDIAIAQPSADSLVRLGLSVQTVADDRNEIAFRLTRLFYDAATGYEQRLGPGVGYALYHHRCSHGADTAVAGRVLIRSGPELGYRLQLQQGPWLLRAHGFAFATLVAQNEDLAALPRGLVGASAQVQLRSGWASWLAGAGLGSMLLSSASDWIATIGDPYDDLKLELLPSAALGVIMHGQRADFRIVAHYQRILDTGVGAISDPASLLALQLGFLY